jgi:hypothetical protein
MAFLFPSLDDVLPYFLTTDLSLNKVEPLTEVSDISAKRMEEEKTKFVKSRFFEHLQL